MNAAQMILLMRMGPAAVPVLPIVQLMCAAVENRPSINGTFSNRPSINGTFELEEC